MTISTTASRISYNGNGVTVAFSFPYRFLLNSDLVVVLRSSAGVETTLVLGTHYTLTGAGSDAGGTVTMVTAPAIGERLVIYRDTAITQETDYISGDPFPAETHERALDRLTIIAQEQQDNIDRTLRFPVSDTVSPDLPTQAVRANKLLAFDALGNPTTAVPMTDSSTDVRLDLAASTGAAMVGADDGDGGSLFGTVQEGLEYLSGELLEAQANPNNGYVGLVGLTSSAMILGDSITEGTGASSYTNGYAYQVARSLVNARDNGFQNDPGFGWHTDINQVNAINTGLTTTGSVSATGLVANRRSLAAGQSITVTGRAFNSVYVVYDGALSTGSLVIARNGVTLSTQAVSGSVLNNTTAVTNTWAEGDTLTVTASGGTVVVCGVLTVKTAQLANLLYVAGKSGYAYQDYTTTAALDEIAYWLNLFRSGSEKLLVLNLGTNNLYNAGKAKTPAAMVAEITSLISGINSRCSSVRYVIAVPPKANEATFPIQSSGYTYRDYVAAIVEFANSNGHGLLRHDLSILSRRTDLYGDGVHPNNLGHRVMAQTVCAALGVSLNPYVRTAAPTELSTAVTALLSGSQADINMNDTWGAFLADSSLRAKAHVFGNTVVLSGIVQPNGSVSTTLGTLPSGYRPAGRTCYLVGRNNSGPTTLQIDVSGVITIASVPTWFSLEGITFAVTRT